MNARCICSWGADPACQYDHDAAGERESRIEELRAQLIALPAFRREALQEECCDAIAEASADAVKLAVDRTVERYLDACIAMCVTNRDDARQVVAYLESISSEAP